MFFSLSLSQVDRVVHCALSALSFAYIGLSSGDAYEAIKRIVVHVITSCCFDWVDIHTTGSY